MHAETTMAITTNQRVFRATQQNPQSKLESGVTMPLDAERTNDINDHSLQASAGFATSTLADAASLPSTGIFTQRNQSLIAKLACQSISLPGAAQNKHSRLTKSPKGITTRGPSPLMSIHLVEAPGWLCTIYGTTKAKKASISTRMQPRMLIRFFRNLYI